MEQRAMSMSVGTMVCATERAKAVVTAWVELACKALDDDDKTARVDQHECRACYYAPYRCGGACVTTRPCMCCGAVQTYPSTDTDALCKACATEHSLCKRCGGDLDMRVRRKEWPRPRA